MKIMTYRDLHVDKKHGYEMSAVSTKPSDQVLKEQIVPAFAGFPPLHVRHIRFLFGPEAILIISQTDYELTDIKRAEIVKGARKFLSTSHKE